VPSPLYPRPFVNHSSETIPAFAIFEVGGWVDNSKGVSVFKAVKPTKAGKLYYVNGPLAVPVNGNGWAASADGHWVLYEGNTTPQLNQEYGPKVGSWALNKDGKGGFVIVADPRGAPASQPGLPPTASTKRIRVVELAKAEVPNRVQGTVASTASESSPTFLLNKLVILSGVDPRQDPDSQVESIVIQNSLRKAYVNGVDRVTASQSKSDGLWYPETSVEASDLIPFELIENKRYNDTAKLARPVLPNGEIDTSQQFYVVDERKQFYGKFAQTGQTGFRGMAVKFTEDYQNGVPGYLIDTMEGPALLINATLDADLNSAADVGITLTEEPNAFGLPFTGRLPPASGLRGYDDLGVGRTLRPKSGDKWTLIWSQQKERYVLRWPFIQGNYITVKGIVLNAISRTDASFVITSPIAVNGDTPRREITVKNDPPINTPGSKMVYARYNKSLELGEFKDWDTGDAGNIVYLLRGQPGNEESNTTVLEFDGTADPAWHRAGVCDPP
jgi:hypothetical protein